MSTAVIKIARVLTEEEAEARRKRMEAIIEEVELEILMREGNKRNEQSATDI
jgi:hypothetical protein